MHIGYIYKISSKDNSIKDFYIGSTTNFTNRKKQHKQACKYGGSMYVHYFICNNNGWCNWKMSIIEQIKYNNKSELTSKETEYINKLTPTLNIKNKNNTNKITTNNKPKINKELYQEYINKLLFSNNFKHLKKIYQ